MVSSQPHTAFEHSDVMRRAKSHAKTFGSRRASYRTTPQHIENNTALMTTASGVRL